MEHGPHVVKAGVQHIDPVDELRVSWADGLEYAGRAGCRQGSQRQRFFDAEDARLGRAVRSAGVDKRARFSHGDVGGAARIAQGLADFERAASAARMQNDDLSVVQVRSDGMAPRRRARMKAPRSSGHRVPARLRACPR